jgi:hypothetical protein
MSQDTSRDRSSSSDHDVSDDDGTWMSYGDLAKLRQIDRASAFKLAMRHKWRRQKNNQGQVTVLVPFAWTASQDDDGDVSHVNAAFETALTAIEAAHTSEVTALREQIATAEAARIAAQALVEQLAGQLRDAAEAAKVERDRAAAEAAELRADRDAARAEAQASEDAAEALRQEDRARQARGRWQRIRAAWRGEL